MNTNDTNSHFEKIFEKHPFNSEKNVDFKKV